MYQDVIVAVLISFGISAVLCPIVIPLLHRLKFGQQVRQEGPKEHLKKQGTPTMGGVMFLGAIVVTSLFYIGRYPELVPVLFVTVGFGIIGFFPEKKASNSSNKSKISFFNKLSHFSFGAIIVVAISIVIGEFGDKTFLASLGLGLEYPAYKFSLICGSIFGMCMSNLLAIFCGKFLSKHLKPSFVSILSNVIFLVFGLFGMFRVN